MDDLPFYALGKAWLVTMVAVTVFSTAVALAHIWDARVFYRALQDTLVHSEI